LTQKSGVLGAWAASVTDERMGRKKEHREKREACIRGGRMGRKEKGGHAQDY